MKRGADAADLGKEKGTGRELQRTVKHILIVEVILNNLNLKKKWAYCTPYTKRTDYQMVR